LLTGRLSDEKHWSGFCGNGAIAWHDGLSAGGHLRPGIIGALLTAREFKRVLQHMQSDILSLAEYLERKTVVTGILCGEWLAGE